MASDFSAAVAVGAERATGPQGAQGPEGAQADVGRAAGTAGADADPMAPREGRRTRHTALPYSAAENADGHCEHAAAHDGRAACRAGHWPHQGRPLRQGDFGYRGPIFFDLRTIIRSHVRYQYKN